MADLPSHKSRHASPRGMVAASVAIAPAAVLALSMAALDPGAQLERGLSAAAAAETRLIAEATRLPAPRTAVAFEEGSEGFWLSRAPEGQTISRVTWTAPVATGDRVVVNFGPYDREIIDVVSVEQESVETTRIDTGDGKEPHYLVTGRRLAEPDGELVRLTVDAAGRGLTMLTGGADRAL